MTVIWKDALLTNGKYHLVGLCFWCEPVGR